MTKRLLTHLQLRELETPKIMSSVKFHYVVCYAQTGSPASKERHSKHTYITISTRCAPCIDMLTS